MASALDPMKRDILTRGTVIPAHPLALTAERRLDERRQRALTRYYLAAGVGGVAVGVHTTQFEIRRPGVDLFHPVLALASEVVENEARRPVLRIAGVCGNTPQAVAEAELARELGYDAVLLSPLTDSPTTETDLLTRAKNVGEVLPLVGFYLQPAVGGRYLSFDFWRSFAELPSVVAIKIAPFDRYRTLDVVRAVTASGRADDIALYTGNDDNIVGDLVTPYRVEVSGGIVTRWIVGGLLGQWAVWTRTAVRLTEAARRARDGDAEALRRLLEVAPQLTDANAAVFDAANGFRGAIAGVHEVLRRQGLLEGSWCLDPADDLSAGQADEIARVALAYPWLTDDAFVAEHLEHWLA